jgi:hypothetical protein
LPRLRLAALKELISFCFCIKFVYRDIVPGKKPVLVVSFSDEKGGVTRHPMADNWPLEVPILLRAGEKWKNTSDHQQFSNHCE